MMVTLYTVLSQLTQSPLRQTVAVRRISYHTSGPNAVWHMDVVVHMYISCDHCQLLYMHVCLRMQYVNVLKDTLVHLHFFTLERY